MLKMDWKLAKKFTKSSAMSSSLVALASPILNPVPTGCSTLDISHTLVPYSHCLGLKEKGRDVSSGIRKASELTIVHL